MPAQHPARLTREPASREEALVFAARALAWSLRMPVQQRKLPVFSIAALHLLEEALEAYENGA